MKHILSAIGGFLVAVGEGLLKSRQDYSATDIKMTIPESKESTEAARRIVKNGSCRMIPIWCPANNSEMPPEYVKCPGFDCINGGIVDAKAYLEKYDK
jgi:hypothetical protein